MRSWRDRSRGKQEDEVEDGVGAMHEDRVYRPLLFQSKGYASSALVHDAYEMRTRMTPSSSLLEPPATRDVAASVRPRIRLETLSSRATMLVLWLTYATFVAAVVGPYLQSHGYLETVIELEGDECDTLTPVEVPCIDVDTSTGVAQWTAVVHNVSRYAGSVEVRVHIHNTRSQEPTPSDARLVPHRWDQATKAAAVTSGQIFGLHYDVFLFGMETAATHREKEWITAKYNQTAWITCSPETMNCETTTLLEISPDSGVIGGTGYETYMAMVVFHGLYPNVIGHDVRYEFAYTKPVLHVSELVLRTGLLLVTVLALPCWLISVLEFHGSWHAMLSVQKWVFALGVVLMLWQNPVAAAAEWYRTVGSRTRLVADLSESFAQAFFYVFWLHLMDETEGDTTGGSFLKVWRRHGLKILWGLALFGIDAMMTVLRISAWSAATETDSIQAWSIATTTATTTTNSSLVQNPQLVFVLLGIVRIAMLLTWLIWIARISWQTQVHLRTLPYMTTRFKQLSYRFLFLQTLLILIDVLVVTARQVLALLQAWYLLGADAFVQRAMREFLAMHTGRAALGQFVFLSVYVYLILFVHLPPATGTDSSPSPSSGLMASTAFHVEDHTRVDQYGFLLPDSHLFCVETAARMLDIAWQAYFDPVGHPSPSGYGELKLHEYGYELVTQLRGRETDTYAIVAVNALHNRLVIAFRGTTSKLNWKSNLRFHQDVLWIKSRGTRSDRTCMERVRDGAAKIPVLNMALPRVHSGFWQAYASVRSELREVLRLVLDENPGVSVFVTGHSMGGSMAILAAYDLAVNFSMQVSMYNFGGPRVGNPSFVRLYDKSVPTSYRVVMDGDIVPGVPDFWGLYQHVGTEVLLDVEGNLIVDPSFVEKKLHVSSRRRVATHPTRVYRASMTKCLQSLMSS